MKFIVVGVISNAAAPGAGIVIGLGAAVAPDPIETAILVNPLMP